MISLKNCIYTDRWDNETAKVTQMFFDIPEGEIEAVFKEPDVKKIYEESLASEDILPDSVKPHFEIQLICNYGEMYEMLGTADLGIGIVDEYGTQVFDIVNLLPGKDFLVDEAVELWNKGLKASSSK